MRVQRGLDVARRKCTCSRQRERPVGRPGSERGWYRERLGSLEGFARWPVFVSSATGSRGRCLGKKAVDLTRS